MEAYSLFFISYTLILFAQPVMNFIFLFNPSQSFPAGLNLSGGQEDGREKQNPTTLCEAGPGVHRPAPGGRSHLLRDFQRLPSDGTVHAEGRR